MNSKKTAITLFYVLCLWAISFSAWANVSFDQRPEVKNFIDQMVKKYHFKKAELVALFSQVKERPKVIQHVQAPLELKPWYLYQMLFVTEWRIRKGVDFWNKYKDALDRAEQIYGVPAGIIVATIGVETRYGSYTGDYPVLDALTNLAFSGSSRSSFFRHELECFLLLCREQHLQPRKVLGSYAGAIGQPQFMPSSYRDYAINFSGSGKIDLSHNEVDVIGSVANYYKKHGWEPNQLVAIPASTQGTQYQFKLPNSRKISRAELVESGLIPAKYRDEKFKIIQLQGYYAKEYWLSFHNFDVIKRYNSSDLYAMAVYQLSYYIKALKERKNNGPYG